MFVVVFGFHFLAAGLSGEAVGSDTPFETMALCDAARPNLVEQAEVILSRDHGQVVIDWSRCVDRNMLLPGRDAT